MQQPELGRKIAELRKAKGLTQEELVEKCNLNVRTLQRIESGEVMPRSYTLKVISEVLDYKFYESWQNDNRSLYDDFFRKVLDIINLKNGTMKKVSILSTTLLIVLLATFMFSLISVHKNERDLKKQIEQQNRNSVAWFNSGEIDKLMADYAPEACFYRNGHPSYCGKDEIRRIMQKAINAKAFKMVNVELISLNTHGDLAIKKSLTTSTTQAGQEIETINLQHWQKVNGKWLIVNDIDVLISD